MKNDSQSTLADRRLEVEMGLFAMSRALTRPLPPPFRQFPTAGLNGCRLHRAPMNARPRRGASDPEHDDARSPAEEAGRLIDANGRRAYFLRASASAFAPARPRGSARFFTEPSAAYGFQSLGRRSVRSSMRYFW